MKIKHLDFKKESPYYTEEEYYLHVFYVGGEFLIKTIDYIPKVDYRKTNAYNYLSRFKDYSNDPQTFAFPYICSNKRIVFVDFDTDISINIYDESLKTFLSDTQVPITEFIKSNMIYRLSRLTDLYTGFYIKTKLKIKSIKLVFQTSPTNFIKVPLEFTTRNGEHFEDEICEDDQGEKEYDIYLTNKDYILYSFIPLQEKRHLLISGIPICGLPYVDIYLVINEGDLFDACGPYGPCGSLDIKCHTAYLSNKIRAELKSNLMMIQKTIFVMKEGSIEKLFDTSIFYNEIKKSLENYLCDDLIKVICKYVM